MPSTKNNYSRERIVIRYANLARKLSEFGRCLRDGRLGIHLGLPIGW